MCLFVEALNEALKNVAYPLLFTASFQMQHVYNVFVAVLVANCKECD